MYDFKKENIKWFILGASITSNPRFWTGSGNTNKKFIANLSTDGKSITIKKR